MPAILYFLLYAFCGCIIVRFLLPWLQTTVRIWIGLCLGLALEMWLPALCAFFLKFSVAAQLLALLPLCVLTLGTYFARSKAALTPFSVKDRKDGLLLLCIALPLTLLGAYLQWTHNIRPLPDGSLHVGQSTYGDLPLHLSIITGLQNASFPPEYVILSGERLCYPFLADSLSATFLLLGFGLRASVVFPGVYMMALVFSGYVLLACRLSDRRRVAALAALLFFINGGLGFLYLVDMQGTVQGTVGNHELQSVVGLLPRIRLVLGGWYQTPTNHAEFTTYNLRWSNVIADMMVPQRTTLAGWSQVLPCLYLLYDCFCPESEPTLQKKDKRKLLLLGVMAGMLPMINTHCFLALGLVSLGWLLWELADEEKSVLSVLSSWAVYGAAAVLLALPQLLTWTFRQSVGNSGFLRFSFNWVNGQAGMPDGWFWFYIKNIGLPFLLILLSLPEKSSKRRFLACGALPVFLAADLFLFQPNPYDNNKLFYIWYMLCAIIAADYAFEIFDRLRGLRARPVIAALCCVCFFASGSLSIVREIVSDYVLFTPEQAEAADFVKENTERDAVFMTGVQPHNFVSSLSGRRIICGPDAWLYYHGYDTTERKSEIERFFAEPLENTDILEKYGVRYIVLDRKMPYETIDRSALEDNYDKIYESKSHEIAIFAVP